MQKENATVIYATNKCNSSEEQEVYFQIELQVWVIGINQIL
jgi:hypothetical protein